MKQIGALVKCELLGFQICTERLCPGNGFPVRSLDSQAVAVSIILLHPSMGIEPTAAFKGTFLLIRSCYLLLPFGTAFVERSLGLQIAVRRSLECMY